MTTHADNSSTLSEYIEFPLSHSQRALWFLQKMVPDAAAHNVAHAVRIRSELDIPLFRQALEKLIQRQPSLRTTFAAFQGEPVQRINSSGDLFFQVEDASRWGVAQLDARLEEEIYRSFDLEHGPLMRVHIFSQAPDNHFLLLMMHHILTDMWSLALVMYETSKLYAELKTGTPASLKPPRARYTDHVQWEADMLAGEEGERLWSFWREHLSGDLPVLDLPTDRPRTPIQTDRGDHAFLGLGPDLTEGIKVFSKAHATTPFTTMLAAFQVLLHRYTGQTDILVGSPKARRRRPMTKVMGYFINPVVLRGNLAGDPTFSDFVGQMHQTVSDAFEHDAFPFPLLVERLQLTRDISRPPVFQVMFSWQKTTRLVQSRGISSMALGDDGKGAMDLAGILVQAVTLRHRPTPFDWTLLIAETDEGFAASVEYNCHLFIPETIQRMLGHYRELLKSIVADPKQRLPDLSMLTENERQQVLVDWNDTAVPQYRGHCVHRLFEAQVERTPVKTAASFLGSVASANGIEEKSLTYRELNQHANQLAHYLQKLGIGPDTLVGISVDRSLEMVIGVLGVLKAGGAFVPLDPTYPSERVAFMLQDAQVPVLLTQERLLEQMPKNGARVICLDTEWSEIAQESVENPIDNSTSENLAYVIYTSGSTGVPKGVMLQHGGLGNLVKAQTEAFGVKTEDRVLQFASFSFDAAVSEIFMALLTGATLYLAPQSTLTNIPELERLLNDHAITTVTLPPSLLTVLSEKDLSGLNTLISAGEACLPEIAIRWSRGRRFFNAYGPTEATIGPTLYPVNDSIDGAIHIPIGGPIANVQIYLLDANLHPVAVGAPGEIHIGGIGLARGYHNRPELTAQKFIPNPFSDEPGARLYKTGDLARYRPDGNIEFLGRVDHQVKVRGFRIELGEIEAVLQRHPFLQKAIVLAREDVPGDKRLTAYVASNNGQDLTASALQHFAQEKLPKYMVPSTFVVMDALPLTPNNKIDRKALPIPTRDRPDLAAAYVRPRNEIERTLAAIWGEALGVEKVGVHDNFFDLGGHSLLVAKVHSQIEEEFGSAPSMVALFQYPTISMLADYLRRGPDGGPNFVKNQERVDKQKTALQRQRQRMRQRRRGSKSGAD